ncbi:MAG: M20/M25/M40 family metallo-hydrolase [Clostridia bacterium]|nr:M20/M25/M40 family metallo-hydrolase [Clostridia bacterium]
MSRREELLDIVRDLCHIPAPSYGEKKRAEYCKKWLENVGATGVYIDEVNNAIFPYNCEGSNEITVIAAHIDTVFPDTESYPEYMEDDEYIYCPGAGDDTAGVSTLLMTAKHFLENNIIPEKGILFVCDACEEGLGNLVGIKQLMKDYNGRVKQFITIDGTTGGVVNLPVGSHRYEIEVRTEGGHSYSRFGNKNAIHALSEIINEIYSIKVPEKEGARTTYNVGSIEGGTSINTIAQSAKMLCEYRSTDRECLEVMRGHFERIFEAAKSDKVEVEVKLLGERPCKGDVDLVMERKLIDAYRHALMEVTGMALELGSGSTDANIPMSLGIPAICIGAFDNCHTSHTREERLLKDSLEIGLDISIKTIKAII